MSDLVHRMKLAMRGIPSVGAIAIARSRTATCELGERGVCYHVFARTWGVDGEMRSAGYSFIFERGGYDDYRPDEVAERLQLTGEICADVMPYRYTNVGRLHRDFVSGRFASALVRPARTKGTAS